MRFLRLFRPVLLLLSLLALATPALPARAQGQGLQVNVTQVDGSRFPLVTLYVSVTGPNGEPAVGLSRDELRVREDGKPVEIVDFRGSGGSPVHTLLIVDRSGSMRGEKIDGARRAVRTFVDQMRPGDEVSLLLFAETPELAVPLTGDQAVLREAASRIPPRDSTSLFDGVLEGLQVLDPVAGRKSAIVLSDGMDTSSGHTLGETIGAASQAGVTLYTIGLGERGELDEGALQQLASQTGGSYFHAPGQTRLRPCIARSRRGSRPSMP